MGIELFKVFYAASSALGGEKNIARGLSTALKNWKN